MSYTSFTMQRRRDNAGDFLVIPTCMHAYPQKCTQLAVVIEGTHRLCAYHYDLYCAKRGFHGIYK